MQLDIPGLEQDLPVEILFQRDQVLHHLLLAIDRDLLAAGQCGEIYAPLLPAKDHVHPVMGHALPAKPFTGTNGVQQLDRRMLQHARADPAEHILLRPRFKNNGLHATLAQ